WLGSGLFTSTKEANTAENRAKLGLFGLFVVLLGRNSTGSSDFSSRFPLTLLFSPLRTTFYHILAVSRLLSSRNLQVHDATNYRYGKPRIVVVNQLCDHKLLR
ncbi:MAG TPA: hypothetical protein VM715_17690, partial [Candidatus Acidoferrum sp.]|nr:hypothetical protein [Candidatus Acidoferrum sp.]